MSGRHPRARPQSQTYAQTARSSRPTLASETSISAALSSLSRCQMRIAELEAEVRSLREAATVRPAPPDQCENCENMRQLHEILTRDTQRLLSALALCRSRDEDEVESLAQQVAALFHARAEERRAGLRALGESQQQLLHWYYAMVTAPGQQPLSVLADAATAPARREIAS